jgi:hypothetical protein
VDLLPGRTAVGNLGYYVFDNGQGRAGYGQIVARHFESIGFLNSKCPNPSWPPTATYQFVIDAVTMYRRSCSVTSLGATASRRCCLSAPSTRSGMSSSV